MSNSLEQAARKTADYLYKVDGDCPPELYQAFATLRQLINEEFKPEKSVSTQFIYDVLYPKILAYFKGKIPEREREAYDRGYADACNKHNWWGDEEKKGKNND
jgi:hypothetical protein